MLDVKQSIFRAGFGAPAGLKAGVLNQQGKRIKCIVQLVKWRLKFELNQNFVFRKRLPLPKKWGAKYRSGSSLMIARLPKCWRLVFCCSHLHGRRISKGLPDMTKLQSSSSGSVISHPLHVIAQTENANLIRDFLLSKHSRWVWEVVWIKKWQSNPMF